MDTKRNPALTVFEHQSIYVGEKIGGVDFTETLLKAMQTFYGKKGVPYYSLLNKGVKFCEYVGVIQIGKTTIEVLPKADKTDTQEEKWRKMLISMLLTVGIFNIKAPTSSSLKLKPNSILDLYIELFISETEYLLHAGLIKKYRKIDSNYMALKGNILFARHIQQNLVHQERFFTRHSVYDKHHQLHRILYKTLLLLNIINTNTALQSRIGSLLLNFPEQSDIKVFDSNFEKIVFTRKSEPYRKALEIARLLLLNYHPNVSQGAKHVLALMFDMNMLWERFVYVTIKKYMKSQPDNYTVTAQTSKYFWKPKDGKQSSIKPDIVITKDENYSIVLDTKWKNVNGVNPSPDDLRQLYVYHEFYNAQKVALVYPGSFNPIRGNYYDKSQDESEKECSVIGIKAVGDINQWREEIGSNIVDWINIKNTVESSKKSVA